MGRKVDNGVYIKTKANNPIFQSDVNVYQSPTSKTNQDKKYETMRDYDIEQEDSLFKMN